MDASTLFDRVRSLWPDAIILKTRDLESGEGPLWDLIHTYEVIEERTDEDPWLEVGAWAFHQALSDVAHANLSAGKEIVRSTSVTIAAFDAYMRDNLADESWELERAMYASSNDT